jgi:cobaltochelatase CobS
MKLQNATTRELKSAVKSIWRLKGQTGFDLDRDGRTAKKENLISFILGNFNQEEILDAFNRATDADITKLFDDGKAPAPIDPTGHNPITVDDADDANDAKAILEILNKRKAPAIDLEAIQKMIDDKVATATAEMVKTLKVEKVIKIEKLDGSVVKVDGATHDCLEDVIQLAKARENILLVGPAGSGKTTLAGQVAKALDLPFAHISLSGGVSETNLTGTLLPIKAGGQFAYVSVAFVDLYENGGVFLLDDLGGASADTMLCINSALANGSMRVEHKIESPEIKRHKDFVCIGATNVTHASASYTGQEAIDLSVLDRFVTGTVTMDYSEMLEEKLIDDDVLLWGRKIRQKIADKKIEGRIMSTRALVGFTKQKRLLGWGRVKWERSYFATWTADEKNKVA